MKDGRFEVGDRVRCVEGWADPTNSPLKIIQGKVYTISKVNNYHTYKVQEDPNSVFWGGWRFELVSDFKEHSAKALLEKEFTAALAAKLEAKRVYDDAEQRLREAETALKVIDRITR